MSVLDPNRPSLDFHVGLSFAEYPDHYHCAVDFRRIEPDTTPADDAELIERIRRCGAQVPA